MRKHWWILVAGLALAGCQGEAPTAEPAPASSAVPGKVDEKGTDDGQLSINPNYKGK